MTRIDLIVAVRNEEKSIPTFLERVRSLELADGVALKVVFVEDSSRDGTVALLRRIAADDPTVGYLSLRRGHGQGLALIFGLSRSTADAAILMDVDGSHPPELIPEMVRAFLDGARVVQCTRRSLANRRLYRRVGSAAFLSLVRAVSGADVAEQNIFFRLISADTARWLLAHPRYWRTLRFPLPEDRSAVRFILADTRERTQGSSQYGMLRLLGLGLDGVLSLTSAARLRLLAVLAALLGALLLWRGLWPVALAMALGSLGVARRYRDLGRREVLEGIEVAECGNAVAAAPSW